MTQSKAKKRILLAAGPIFARKGFKNATVREICDSAGVNVASVNYYFGDKQQLYLETVILARQMRVEQAPFPKWNEETPPESKLRDFIRILLRRFVAMETVPWQVHLLVRETLNPTEACEKLVEEYFRPFFNRLLSIVDELAEQPLPEIQRQKIGFSIIGQCVHYRFSSGVMSMLLDDDEYEKHFDLDELTNHISEFSLGAVQRLTARQSFDLETKL